MSALHHYDQVGPGKIIGRNLAAAFDAHPDGPYLNAWVVSIDSLCRGAPPLISSADKQNVRFAHGATSKIHAGGSAYFGQMIEAAISHSGLNRRYCGEASFSGAGLYQIQSLVASNT
jgi:hypothetical protein